MAYGQLVTKLTADLTDLRKQLRDAEKLFTDYHRRSQQMGTTVLGARAGGGGGGAAGAGRMDPTDRLNARLNRQISRQDFQDERRRQDALISQAIKGARILESEDQKQMAARMRRSEQFFDTTVKANRRKRREEKQEADRQLQEDRRRQDDRISQAIKGARILNREDEKQRRQHGREVVQGEVGRIGKSQKEEKQQQRQALKDRRFEATFKVGEEVARIKKANKDQARAAKETAKAEAAALREREAAVKRLGHVFDQHLKRSIDSSRQSMQNLVDTAKLLGGTTVLGGIAAFIKAGFELNAQYQLAQFSLTSTFLAATDIIDNQTGKVLKGAEAIKAAGVLSKKTFEDVRKIAAETILTQQELMTVVSENLGLAARAGLKSGKETLTVIAQITQAAKALGLPGGTRQFSQEVRGLLSGEKLQGVTVARLVGFTDVKEIQRLQREGKFATELMKRLQPLIDATRSHADQFAQVVSTLVTKFQDFARLATLPVFQKLTEKFKELRDRFTDEDIASFGTRLGKTLGDAFDAADDFIAGGGLDPLFDFFKFVVAHWKAIVFAFGAWKAAMLGMAAVKNVSDIQKIVADLLLLKGGKTAKTAVARTAAEDAALLFGGGAAPKGLKALGGLFGRDIARIGGGANIGARFGASALGEAVGAGAKTIGAIGMAALVPLAGAALVVASGKAGWELGKVFNSVTIGADEREAQATEKRTQTREGRRAGVIAASMELRRRQQKLTAAENQLRTRGEAPAIGPAAPNANLDQLREGVVQSQFRLREAQRQAEGQVVFGPEIPVGFTAVGQARQIAKDKRKRRIRQGRLDLETEELQLGAAGGSRKTRRAQAQREFRATRLELDADEDLNIKQRNARKKAARKVLARELRHIDEDERMAAVKHEAEIADQHRDTQKKIIADYKLRVLEARKSFADEEISQKQMLEKIGGARAQAMREIRDFIKDRVSALNEAGDAVQDFARKQQDAARRERDFKRELLDFEIQAGRRRRSIARELRDAEQSVTDTLREQKRARQDISFTRAQRAIQKNVEEVLRSPTYTNTPEFTDVQGNTGPAGTVYPAGRIKRSDSIEDQLLRKERPKARRELREPYFTDKVEMLARQRVQATIREVGQAVTGEGGVGAAADILSGHGVELSSDERARLAPGALGAGVLAAGQRGQERIRTAEDESLALKRQPQQLQDLQTDLAEKRNDARRFPEELARAAIELRENFVRSVQDTARDFRDVGQSMKQLVLRLQELKLGRAAVTLTPYANAAAAAAGASHAGEALAVTRRTHGGLVGAGVNTKTLDPRVGAALGASSQLIQGAGAGQPNITLNANFQMSPHIQNLLEQVAKQLAIEGRRQMPAR